MRQDSALAKECWLFLAVPTYVSQEDHTGCSEADQSMVSLWLFFKMSTSAFLQSLGTSLSFHDISKINTDQQGHQAAPSASPDTTQSILWMFMHWALWCNHWFDPRLFLAVFLESKAHRHRRLPVSLRQSWLWVSQQYLFPLLLDHLPHSGTGPHFPFSVFNYRSCGRSLSSCPWGPCRSQL